MRCEGRTAAVVCLVLLVSLQRFQSIRCWLVAPVALATTSRLTEAFTDGVGEEDTSDVGEVAAQSPRMFANEYSSDDSGSADETTEPVDDDWDMLIFTQQWPVTTCVHWRLHDHAHRCALPAHKELWTVHGIWPTKVGTIGPNFCNRSSEFDLSKLQLIMSRLQEYWPTIDGQTQSDWLWQHEWLKHGTCAAELDALNSEMKYFGQGLTWHDRYSIANMLGSSNIHPDSNSTVIALQTALLTVLGKNPSIHCLYDKENDISYLAEIRICFNKTLQLIDCDDVRQLDAITIRYPRGTVNTNCRVSTVVHYPSLLPASPLHPKHDEHDWKLLVVNLYKLVHFIMWFTL